MDKRYIKKYKLSDTDYIGIKLFNYGKEEFCHTEVVSRGKVISKAKNKIYETRKGKYIVKNRIRYYLDKFYKAG